MVAFDGTEVDSTRDYSGDYSDAPDKLARALESDYYRDNADRDQDQDDTVTTITPGERVELSKALHGTVMELYDLTHRLHDLMDHPAIHGPVTGRKTDEGEDIFELSEEWHTIHAAIMALHAGRHLLDRTSKTIKERPA